MIKKLNILKNAVNCVDFQGYTHCVVDSNAIKVINDLVDVVNALIDENNIHEKQIDKLQMKTDTIQDFVDVHSYTIGKLKQKERMIGATTYDKLDSVMNPEIDKYAKYRKWIGCLVEYGNADDGFRYGILTNIEPRYSAYPFEIDNGREATADCWLPSKTIFYKGGDNE